MTYSTGIPSVNDIQAWYPYICGPIYLKCAFITVAEHAVHSDVRLI